MVVEARLPVGVVPLASCKVLHLIRHAQGFHNLPDVPTDLILDAHLTELGYRQAAQLADNIRDAGIKADLIVCSLMARTLQTAVVAFGEQQSTDDLILPAGVAQDGGRGPGNAAEGTQRDGGACGSSDTIGGAQQAGRSTVGGIRGTGDGSSGTQRDGGDCGPSDSIGGAQETGSSTGDAIGGTQQNGTGCGTSYKNGGAQQTGSRAAGGIGGTGDAAGVTQPDGRGCGASGSVRGRLLMVKQQAEKDVSAAHPAVFATDAVPIIATELCRAHLGLNLFDARRPLAFYQAHFPGVDFSLVEQEDDVLWDPHALEADECIRERGVRFLEWLMSRPERSIAVVSHAGILAALLCAACTPQAGASDCSAADATASSTVGATADALRRPVQPPFGNAELRSVVVFQQRCADGFPA